MKKRLYFFTISFVITACILMGFLGICAAYENTVETAYGEQKSAVEIRKNGIRILDFEYKTN